MFGSESPGRLQVLFISLAIFSGFFTALSDILSKDYIRRFSVDGLFTLYVRWLLCSIFLLPSLFFTGIPDLSVELVVTYVLLLPLELAAGFLYMRALEIADSTLVLPFQSFTPLLIPPIASIVIGEFYSALGGFGIVLVAVGSFVMLGGRSAGGENRKGVLLMIASATIYAVTSVVGRYIVLRVNPVFFSTSYMLILSAALTPFFARRYGGEGFRKVGRTVVFCSLVGFTTAVAVLTHFLAAYKVEIGYVISLKRSSVLFSVLLGYLLLSERTEIGKRMVGAFLMTVGIFIIGYTIR